LVEEGINIGKSTSLVNRPWQFLESQWEGVTHKFVTQTPDYRISCPSKRSSVILNRFWPRVLDYLRPKLSKPSRIIKIATKIFLANIPLRRER